MRDRSIRPIFMSGAIFNWLAGLALFYDPVLLFRMIGISPVPSEPLFLQLFASLVMVFGVGYFWVSRDAVANAPIIRLGMLGKLGVVIVGMACVLAQIVSWQLMILVSVDLIYAVLFWRTLKKLAVRI